MARYYKGEIIKELASLTTAFPEQRMGQIIYNYVIAKAPNKDIFYLEDGAMLEILQKTNEQVEITRLERRLKKALEHPETRARIYETLVDEELI